MARVQLVPTEITVVGVEEPVEVDGDPTNDHYFENDAQETVFLQVRNAGVTPHTLTLEIPGEVDTGIPKTDRVISIPAGETWYVGPFDGSIYNQEDDPDTLAITTAVYVNPASADLKLILLQLGASI